jgi:type II secretory pathway component PulF
VDEHGLATASLSESLAGCPHLTPEFVAVLATAEHTGDFTPLRRLAELYEDGFR